MVFTYLSFQLMWALLMTRIMRCWPTFLLLFLEQDIDTKIYDVSLPAWKLILIARPTLKNYQQQILQGQQLTHLWRATAPASTATSNWGGPLDFSVAGGTILTDCLSSVKRKDLWLKMLSEAKNRVAQHTQLYKTSRPNTFALQVWRTYYLLCSY